MRILTVIGARPQFIKAAMVSKKILGTEGIEEIILHTGQHFDERMSSIFFEELQIPKPHYNLGINQMNHGAMTGRMIEEIEKVIIKENPDWVLVYGDTNSTLAGAIASKKLHVKLAHVEAGLRSFNMKMPEEINRILTDRVSDLLLCPTENSVKNLVNEGFGNFDCKIINVGDVMLDATNFYFNLAENISNIIGRLELSKPYILCTIHREENTADKRRFNEIIQSLEILSQKWSIVCPLHPRTKNILGDINKSSEIIFIEPVGYLDMQMLLGHCDFVMTDSGGLQKEAFFHGKKCFTLRDETEWTELVDCGANEVVGAKKERIIGAVEKMNYSIDQDFSSYNFYGKGDAGKKIIDVFLEQF